MARNCAAAEQITVVPELLASLYTTSNDDSAHVRPRYCPVPRERYIGGKYLGCNNIYGEVFLHLRYNIMQCRIADYNNTLSRIVHDGF
eukprot:6182475-Pleurochrysis_carterae.AAC.3